MNPEPHLDVLVVGAGPTGLTAALAGVQQGLRVRIIDQRPHRALFSKALVTHARTLEVLEPLGIVGELLAAGTLLHAIQAHGSYGAHARLRLDQLSWGDTKYPHLLLMPQYDVESILETALRARGVTVEWSTRCSTVQQNETAATAVVQSSDGPDSITSTDSTTSTESISARWILGADGGHSTVRQAAGISFEPRDAKATFLLVDAHSTADLRITEAQVTISPDGVLLLIPVTKHGLWRIVAHLPDEAVETPEAVTAQQVDRLVAERTGLTFGAHNIGWVSRFSPSHGVASALRSGRIFLAGDAAHVHSPVGGQGMNYGIQDAQNLMWKLATAAHLEPALAEHLLDSYQAERLPVITSMVAQVRRFTTVATKTRRFGRRLLGTVGPRVLEHTALRNVLGPPLAGLDIRYRHGELVIADDASSGTRAIPTPQPLPAGAWSWRHSTSERHSRKTQLVRPDAVVAASGASRSEIVQRIAHHPLLNAILAQTDPVETSSRP